MLRGMARATVAAPIRVGLLLAASLAQRSLAFLHTRCRVSNEELAALSLCVYEEGRAGAEAGFTMHAGLLHIVRGWVRVRREELAARDMRVDVYESARQRASVIAVRGTVLSDENFKADFDVAVGNMRGHLVEMLQHLQGIVRQTAESSKDDLYLTGHSLGAYVACLAYFNLTLDAELRRRIARVVLFESPGVPDLKPGARVVPDVELEPWWGEVRPRIVEFLGAPSMLNTIHRHVGGEMYRVKKDHLLVITKWHILRCTLGSVSRVLNFAALLVWAWTRTKIAQDASWREVADDTRYWSQQMLEYETLTYAEQQAWSKRAYLHWFVQKRRRRQWLKAHADRIIQNAEPVVKVIDVYYLAANTLKLAQLLFHLNGFVRTGLGLHDEMAWTVQQHGMIGLWQSFELGADLPRPSSYQIVKQWPRGARSAALNLVRTCLRGLVPFHPAVPGLHNLRRPNSLAEARVCRMQGYVYEKPPRAAPAPRPGHQLLAAARAAARLAEHWRREALRAGQRLQAQSVNVAMGLFWFARGSWMHWGRQLQQAGQRVIAEGQRCLSSVQHFFLEQCYDRF